MIKSDIGNNIKKYRTEKELSQADIARSLGVTRQAISSWETGRTEPSINDIEKLSLIFNCSKSELLGDYKSAMELDEYMGDPYLRDFVLFAGANRPKEHLEEFYAALKQMYSALLKMRH